MSQPIIDVPAIHEHRLKMSYEEFLAWADEDTHAEWVNGEVIVFMPPTTMHQRVAFFLEQLLSIYARLLGLGEVFHAPYEMRIAPGGSAREPDILFVTNQHADQVVPERLIGPADLVVEVISASSVALDRGDKFYEYQEGGVREYWIIDPRPGKERVDVYWLTPQGRFQATLPDADGRYHATVLPGFWFRPEWLWQEPLPEPLALFVEIRGLSTDIIQALQDTPKGDDMHPK